MEHVTVGTYEGKCIPPCGEHDRYTSPALIFAAAGGDLERIDFRRVIQNLHWSQLWTLSDWFCSPDTFEFELYFIRDTNEGAKSISIWCYKSDGAIICEPPDGSRFTAVLPA